MGEGTQTSGAGNSGSAGMEKSTSVSLERKTLNSTADIVARLQMDKSRKTAEKPIERKMDALKKNSAEKEEFLARPERRQFQNAAYSFSGGNVSGYGNSRTAPKAEQGAELDAERGIKLGIKQGSAQRNSKNNSTADDSALGYSTDNFTAGDSALGYSTDNFTAGDSALGHSTNASANNLPNDLPNNLPDDLPDDSTSEDEQGKCPDGWEAEIFENLPSEVQELVRKRESVLSSALRETQEKQKTLQQDAVSLSKGAAKELQNALEVMRSLVEAEYRTVNWDELKKNDPLRHMEMQTGFQARMNAVRQIHQNMSLLQRQQEALQAQEQSQRLMQEKEAVFPELKALFGQNFNSDHFVRDLLTYLDSQAIPREVLHGMTRGYELKTVAKAMLYDKISAQKGRAEKKIAEAPKVSIKNSGTADGNDGYRRARAMLRKNPNSTEALAEVLSIRH